MAINMFSKTIIFITLYEPNISIAQNRVKLLMPCSSKAIKSTNPNEAQNSDWDVSNKLRTCGTIYYTVSYIQIKFTLQIVAKFHRLFRCYQNPANHSTNDSTCSSPNRHNTIAIDLSLKVIATSKHNIFCIIWR